MKKVILFLFLFAVCHLSAQLPIGVKKLSGIQNDASFMLKDAAGTVWVGLGGLTSSFMRRDSGLLKFRNNQLVKVYSKGMFTDALQMGPLVYFTAYDGLYTYKNDSMLFNTDINSGTSIANYKNTIWIGTMGNGLHEMKNGTFQQKYVNVNGVSFDSVYSLCADGKILWIGTSKGLIKYDGNSYSQVAVPFVPAASYYKYSQKTILSMQIDGKGRLWILNANATDTIPCLYFLENGKFRDAMMYYREQCYEWGSIPYQAFRLGRTASGHILLGTSWGVIELSDRIQNHVLSPTILNSNKLADLNKIGQSWVFAYEGPDQMLYASTVEGILEVDRSKYSLETYKQTLYKSNIRSTNTIDINDINANISNDGIMFNSSDIFRAFDGQPAFSLKSIGCNNVTYSGGIWMGGISGGDLHVAAQTYRQKGSDFRPGPVNMLTLVYDSILGQQYNKVWKIDRQTIDEFLAKRKQPGYNIPSTIMDWPGNAPPDCHMNMAPYFDINNNGVYEPIMGDYPAIKGDQMLWWVFNDFAPHGETGGKPILVQIAGICYAYKDARLAPKDSDFVVNRTLFFEYEVTNLGHDMYDNFYMGVYNDIDLGNYADDNVGCDSVENSSFGFNGDNFDEGREGFGKNPPMIICKFLNQKMSNFIYYNNDQNPVNGNPDEARDYYALMRSGRYKVDSLIFVNPYPSHNYPCTAQVSSVPRDLRSLMSFSVGKLSPGSSFKIDFAYIVLHDPDKDFLKDDCGKPKLTLRKIQKWYDTDSFPSKPYWPSGTEKVSSDGSLKIYPNPAHSVLNIQGEQGKWNIIEVRLLDQAGRVVMTQTIPIFGISEIQMDVSHLAGGLYFVQVIGEGQVYNSKFFKQD